MDKENQQITAITTWRLSFLSMTASSYQALLLFLLAASGRAVKSPG